MKAVIIWDANYDCFFSLDSFFISWQAVTKNIRSNILYLKLLLVLFNY